MDGGIVSIPAILSIFKGMDIFQTFIILSYGVIFYYLYVTNQHAKEINNSVNHKGSNEPTLREATMEIRERILNMKEDNVTHFTKIDRGLGKLGRKINNHEDRIKILEE